MTASDTDSAAWTREISREVRADPTTVFNLICEVELWPALFRHVRSARVLRREGQRRLIVVRAIWRGLPLGCTAILTVDADAGQVTIRHLSGLTRGSRAIWMVSRGDCTLRPADCQADAEGAQRTLVTAHQRVVVPVPVIGGHLARWFVGGRVARDLGESMIDRLKEIAEGGSLAARD